MEILPVTNQFNVGFSSEKGELTFYFVRWWELVESRPSDVARRRAQAGLC